MQTRNFDSSAHTKRKQGRMLYANYVIRSTSVNKNPGLIARPLATGSPIGSGSGVNYANYIEEVVQGGFQTTPAEQQDIINRNFPTPAPPVIPPSPLTPDPTPQDTTSWGYYIIYEGDDNTYQYILYDDTTKLWSGPLGSGMVIYDYYIDDFVTYTPNGVVIGYYSNGILNGYYRYVLEYLTYNASLLNTISYIDEGDSGFNANQYITFIQYLDPEVDPNLRTLKLYNNETNTPIKTATYSSDYYVDDYAVLRTGVYFILTTDNVTYAHYIWNINDDAPTQLFTTYDRGIDGGYRYTTFNNNDDVYYDYVVVLGSSDGVHFDTIYCAQGNKTLTSYSIPNATNYTDFGYYDTWGAYYKNMSISIYNHSTDSIDFYIFRSLPDVRPTNVVMNLSSQIINTYYNYNDPNQYNTGITNTYLIVEKEPIPYYIASGEMTGGVTPLFNGGNYITLLISSFSGEFISTNYYQNYGAKLNTTANPYDDGTQYGYLVSPINVYPHNSTTFISAYGGYDSGETANNHIQVGVYDYLAGASANYSFDRNEETAYTTSGSRRGRYYTQQLYGATGYPSVCQVWFTIESVQWNSSYDSTDDGRINYVYQSYPSYIGVYGYNIILCKVLLSAYNGTTGTLIANSDIENFLSNYVENADLMATETDFSTIDMIRFRNWQQNPTNDYTSTIPNFYRYTYNRTGNYNYNSFVNGKIHTCFEGLPILTKELTGNTKFCQNIVINKAGITFLLSNDYILGSELITPTSDISMNILYTTNNDINLYDTNYNGAGYIGSGFLDNYSLWFVPIRSSDKMIFFVLDNTNSFTSSPANMGGYNPYLTPSKDSVIVGTPNTIFIIVNGESQPLYVNAHGGTPYYDYYANNYSFTNSYPDTGNGYSAFWYTDEVGNLSNILTSSTGWQKFAVSDAFPNVRNYAMISNCAFYYSSDNGNGFQVAVAYTDTTVHSFSTAENEGWYSYDGINTTPNGFYLPMCNSNDSSYASLTYTLSNAQNPSGVFHLETTKVPPDGYNVDCNYSTYNYTYN